jgi:hypothetical protein
MVRARNAIRRCTSAAAPERLSNSLVRMLSAPGQRFSRFAECFEAGKMDRFCERFPLFLAGGAESA